MTRMIMNLTHRQFETPDVFAIGQERHTRTRAETVTVANGIVPPSVHVSTLSFN